MNDMDKALETMINNMPEKTGKSLEEWKTILKGLAFEKHSEGVKYLKSEHGVTHGFANTIVTLSKEEKQEPLDLVSAQYKGKENLVPVYESLLRLLKSFGDDVVVSPKKTSVSFIRKRQFALIKPATKSRIDVGLKLKGVPEKGRLGNSGPFGTMCTHRIQVSNVSEVDQELKEWLELAYNMSV